MSEGCPICGTVHEPVGQDALSADANCPPCWCFWCRYRRGQTLTPGEMAAIRAHDLAIQRDAKSREAQLMRDAMAKRWGK